MRIKSSLPAQSTNYINKLMRISLHERPWRISTTRSAQSKFRVEHMSIFSLSALLPFGARRGIRGYVCGGNNENLIISRPGTLPSGCIKIRNERPPYGHDQQRSFVIFSSSSKSGTQRTQSSNEMRLIYVPGLLHSVRNQKWIQQALCQRPWH